MEEHIFYSRDELTEYLNELPEEAVVMVTIEQMPDDQDEENDYGEDG